MFTKLFVPNYNTINIGRKHRLKGNFIIRNLIFSYKNSVTQHNVEITTLKRLSYTGLILTRNHDSIWSNSLLSNNL